MKLTVPQLGLFDHLIYGVVDYHFEKSGMTEWHAGFLRGLFFGKLYILKKQLKYMNDDQRRFIGAAIRHEISRRKRATQHTAGD